MKITKLALLGCCMAMAMSVSSVADTIATWTFETSLPATAGPHAAEVGTGSATGSHAGATVYSNPAGNGTAESFSSTNWVAGDYYQFTTSSLGFDSLAITFDATSSNTGPKDFKVQTSLDGSSFADVPFTYAITASAGANAWSAGTYLPIHTFTTSLPSSLDDEASIFVRLVQVGNVSANGGTVASGGTSRVDTVTISGTPLVPEPASIVLLLGSFGAMLIRRK